MSRNIRTVLVFGGGSIGARHARNVRAILPSVNVVIADPIKNRGQYTDWRTALDRHRDGDVAIIASPHECHLEQAQALATAGIPFYLEKPPCTIDQFSDYVDLVDRARDMPCAVGFQYRYHSALRKMPIESMVFVAQEPLVERYGSTVEYVSAPHPIDLAIYRLGKATGVALFSDGINISGRIMHGKHWSGYVMGMDAAKRYSIVLVGHATYEMIANDEMYERAMAAWLHLVSAGKHDGILATLQDGLNVMQVLRQVHIVPRLLPRVDVVANQLENWSDSFEDQLEEYDG